MKLTGNLRDKVFNTDSLEERRDIIAQAGMELTDDELEVVAGGMDEKEAEAMREMEEAWQKARQEDPNQPKPIRLPGPFHPFPGIYPTPPEIEN